MADEILVVMGVSGSGKSTVAKLLAEEVGGAFLEGDEFHPEENLRKMKKGIPLTDLDRAPWLEALSQAIAELPQGRQVVSCSALKKAYRDVLRAGGRGRIRFIYLRGERPLLLERIKGRRGHFMPADLLDSQLADLEPPKEALALEITASPPELVQQVLEGLGQD